MIRPLKTRRTRPNVTAVEELNIPQKAPVTRSYANPSELKDRLQDLDKAEDGAKRTVILLLNKDFVGHLPSLIRRKNPGQQIIITSGLGYLPGLVSRNDIAFRAGMLGWDRISFVHNLDDAIQQMHDIALKGEQVVILKPEDAEFSFA